MACVMRLIVWVWLFRKDDWRSSSKDYQYSYGEAAVEVERPPARGSIERQRGSVERKRQSEERPRHSEERSWQSVERPRQSEPVWNATWSR